MPDHSRIAGIASGRELEEFVDQEDAAEICEAIEQAIENEDPGLVDLIIDQLAELETD